MDQMDDKRLFTIKDILNLMDVCVECGYKFGSKNAEKNFKKQ